MEHKGSNQPKRQPKEGADLGSIVRKLWKYKPFKWLTIGSGLGALGMSGLFGYAALTADYSKFGKENLKSEILSETTITYEREEGQKPFAFDTLGSVEEHRNYLTYSELPKTAIYLGIATEDIRFPKRNAGIDFMALSRALAHDLGCIPKKIIGIDCDIQGGSTFEMQLCDRTYGEYTTNLAKKFTQKPSEFICALAVSAMNTKEDIMEFYLNQIPVYGNLVGFASASKYYFNKDSKELDIAEMSYILATLNKPLYYNPFVEDPARRARNIERAKKRTKLVINNAYKAGYISEEEHQSSLKSAEELEFEKGDFSYKKSTIVDLVRNELQRPEIKEAISIVPNPNFSLDIETTINKEMQDSCYANLVRNVSLQDLSLNGIDKIRQGSVTCADRFKEGNSYRGKIKDIKGNSMLLDFCGLETVIDEGGLKPAAHAYKQFLSKERIWSSYDPKTKTWVGNANSADIKKLLGNYSQNDIVSVIFENQKPYLINPITDTARIQGACLVTGRNNEILAMIGNIIDFSKTITAQKKLSENPAHAKELSNGTVSRENNSIAQNASEYLKFSDSPASNKSIDSSQYVKVIMPGEDLGKSQNSGAAKTAFDLYGQSEAGSRTTKLFNYVTASGKYGRHLGSIAKPLVDYFTALLLKHNIVGYEFLLNNSRRPIVSGLEADKESDNYLKIGVWSPENNFNESENRNYGKYVSMMEAGIYSLNIATADLYDRLLDFLNESELEKLIDSAGMGIKKDQDGNMAETDSEYAKRMRDDFGILYNQPHQDYISISRFSQAKSKVLDMEKNNEISMASAQLFALLHMDYGFGYNLARQEVYKDLEAAREKNRENRIKVLEDYLYELSSNEANSYLIRLGSLYVTKKGFFESIFSGSDEESDELRDMIRMIEQQIPGSGEITKEDVWHHPVFRKAAAERFVQKNLAEQGMYFPVKQKEIRPSKSIGSFNASLLQVARAYHGMITQNNCEPFIIKSIRHNKKIIYEAKPNCEQTNISSFSDTNASAAIYQLLHQGTVRGTSEALGGIRYKITEDGNLVEYTNSPFSFEIERYGVKAKAMPHLAGKTGTSQENKDNYYLLIWPDIRKPEELSRDLTYDPRNIGISLVWVGERKDEQGRSIGMRNGRLAYFGAGSPLETIKGMGPVLADRYKKIIGSIDVDLSLIDQKNISFIRPLFYAQEGRETAYNFNTQSIMSIEECLNYNPRRNYSMNYCLLPNHEVHEIAVIKEIKNTGGANKIN